MKQVLVRLEPWIYDVLAERAEEIERAEPAAKATPTSVSAAIIEAWAQRRRRDAEEEQPCNIT